MMGFEIFAYSVVGLSVSFFCNKLLDFSSNNTIIVITIFMIVDFILGCLKASIGKSDKTEKGRLSSNAMFIGFMRKCAMILMIFLFKLVDGLYGQTILSDAACYGVILNEFTSIVENLGLMGVPLPKFVYNLLEVFERKTKV